MLPFTQRLTRRVEFAINGEPRQLVFTHRALMLAEQLTGVDMLDADAISMSASMLRALLFVALSAGGATVPLDEIGRSLRGRIGETRAIVTDAWSASMPDPEDSGPGGDQFTKKQRLTWTDAWGIGREHHGLSLDEWLDMTPRMLAALRRLRLERMQREEFMLAQLTAATINFSFCKPDRPTQTADFMLHKIQREMYSGPDLGDYIMSRFAKVTHKQP